MTSRRFAALNPPVRNRQVSLALLLVGSAATVLTLRLSTPFWTYLPKLRFVQFPWRWMSMIALVAACFIAFAMEKRRGWLWFPALFLLSLSFAFFQVQNSWWDEDEMPTLRDAFDTGHGFDGTDEYDPLGDDHLDLPLNAPLAVILPPDEDTTPPQTQLKFLRWSAEHKEVRVDASAGTRVALRVLNYPAWRVEVNGKRISPERMDDVNQMVVPVEAGSSDIRVDFVRTGDRILGNLISSASALFAAVLLWMSRKRPGKKTG